MLPITEDQITSLKFVFKVSLSRTEVRGSGLSTSTLPV